MGRENRFVGVLERRLRLAGELGFEPRQTESESVVLPLHHSPKLSGYINDIAGNRPPRLNIGHVPLGIRGRSTRSILLLASSRRQVVTEGRIAPLRPACN